MNTTDRTTEKIAIDYSVDYIFSDWVSISEFEGKAGEKK